MSDGKADIIVHDKLIIKSSTSQADDETLDKTSLSFESIRPYHQGKRREKQEFRNPKYTNQHRKWKNYAKFHAENVRTNPLKLKRNNDKSKNFRKRQIKQQEDTSDSNGENLFFLIDTVDDSSLEVMSHSSSR